jgi:hypothetical protein
LTVRSIAALATVEVSALPSWNFTPPRRVNVHVLPSGDEVHLVASSGRTFLVAMSYRVSDS